MSYLFDEIYSKEEEAPAIEDKILLMGLQAAGKTAIKDVVFFNKKPEEMQDYMATVHYQRHFINEEKSSMVIDSGGQESYWNEAVTHFRHLVFSNVKLLIWIVDVTHPEMFEESERRFSFTIRQYKKENPDGRITVLCHKVDLVPPERMVVLHQHIRDSFDDPKYTIDFENTSIYYGESLKELIFTIMKEAGIDTRRFELISNLGQKVEESDEFQSYLMEHKEDPRIAQLLDYLKPEAEITLPTFGKLDLKFDLTDYGIIEIVLIDKKTFSPIVGASSRTNVSTENSMDYLIALHDFKTYVREHTNDIETTGTIVNSKDGKVHGMLFNLDKNFLLISSFSQITEERKQLFFELIFKFAKSTADRAEKEPVTEVVPEPVAEVIPEPVAEVIPEPVAEEISTVSEPIMPSVPSEQDGAPTIPQVPQVPPVPIASNTPQVEVLESNVEIAEQVTSEQMEELILVEEQSITPPAPAPVELVVEESLGEKREVETISSLIEEIEEEIELTETKEELHETHVELEPIIPETTPEEIAEPAPSVPVPSVPTASTVPSVPTKDFTKEIAPEEQIVPGFVEKMVIESLPSEVDHGEEAEAQIMTEPKHEEHVATLNGIGDSSGISFTADDIKNFASFLVQKKDTLLEEISPDAIKGMSDFLTQKTDDEEITEE